MDFWKEKASPKTSRDEAVIETRKKFVTYKSSVYEDIYYMTVPINFETLAKGS